MSDITKCSNGDLCPLRKSCARYTAQANEFYQSYIETQTNIYEQVEAWMKILNVYKKENNVCYYR